MSRPTPFLVPLIVFLVLIPACGGDSGETGGDDVPTVESGTAPDITDETEAAGEGVVRFVAPADDATVTNPVAWEAEVSGFTIEPASEGVNEGAGHLHILVDAGCATAGEVIPNDGTHLHFGDASTSGSIELPPGRHGLCLQAGNGAHQALPLTHEITVVVE